MQYLMQCLVSLAIISFALPWFLLPMTPLMAIFVFIARFFRNCARELKRLDGLTRSPLLSNVQVWRVTWCRRRMSATWRGGCAAVETHSLLLNPLPVEVGVWGMVRDTPGR